MTELRARDVDATPTTLEWLQAFFISPIAGMLIGLGLFGVTMVTGFDPFTPPEVATPQQTRINQLLLAGTWCASSAAVLGWIAWSNLRHRYISLRDGHLTVGRPPRIDVPVDSIRRVRMGAPLHGTLKLVHALSQAAGTFDQTNRAASARLRRTMQQVLVIDTPTQSVVLHVGTLANGAMLVDKLHEATAPLWSQETFSPAELKRFGRFTQGVYPPG